MQPKGKNIHKVLEYLTNKEVHEDVLSEEIADNTKLSFWQVNEVCEFLINKNVVEDCETDDTPPNNKCIKKTYLCDVNYSTDFYIKDRYAFFKKLPITWWGQLIIIIVGGMIVAWMIRIIW